MLQFESTASQCLHFSQQARAGNYLIDTSKALKGSKLKTKEFIRTQLMKFKHTSLNKYNEPIQQKRSLPNKASQYKKFMPFGTIQEDEIHQIIVNQRQQMSRETKGRIKMFQNSKINALFTEHSFHQPANTLQVRSKPATSHQSRDYKQKQSNFNNHTIFFEKKATNTQLLFRTENLGGKMNEFLNLFLIQGKTGVHSQKLQTQQPKVTQNQDTIQYRHNLPFRKKNNPTFMRKMKKHKKTKLQEKSNEPLSQFDSEQIAQQISIEMSQRERTAKLQSRANKNIYNYSVEIRRRGNMLECSNPLQKRQQSDNLFERKIN